MSRRTRTKLGTTTSKRPDTSCMQLHAKKLEQIKKRDKKQAKAKEPADPEDMSSKIKQVKMQANQFKQIEKNSEIN